LTVTPLSETLAFVSERFTQRVAAEIRAEILRIAADTQTKPITQDKLAALAGMSQSTLSRRLTGEVPFDTDELVRVAAALPTSLRKLLLSALAHVEPIDERTATDARSPVLSGKT
jgi:transcriptional regulator with XRE-family HTH domain